MQEAYKVKKGDIVRLVNARTFDYLLHPYISEYINKDFEVIEVGKYAITVRKGTTTVQCAAEYFDYYFKIVKIAKDPEVTLTKKKPIKKVEVKTEYKKPVFEKPGKWTNWATIRIFGEEYAYKTDGKTVILRGGGYKGVSRCHDEDEFSLAKGLEIAFNRLVATRTEKAVDEEKSKAKTKKKAV